MTICRYFLQGICRFGDRCRFEHTAPSHQNRHSQDWGYGRTNQDASSRYSNSSYSNYNWNNKATTNNRPSSNRYSYESNYKPERTQCNDRYYTEPEPNTNYRYNSPNRYSNESNYKTRSNQYNDRYTEVDSDSSDAYYRPHHENLNRENTYQRNSNEFQYSTKDRYSDDNYAQNAYRWQSNDYRQQKSQFNRSGQSDYQTSTPKPSSSFSFKVPESDIKAYKSVASSFGSQLDERDQKFAELVKEDAIAWELGEQWPFTCYFPDPGRAAFPGFSDTSPEELRCEAYKAKASDSYSAYIETVNNALVDVQQKREQLKRLTPELLSILIRIRKGEDLSQESTFAESSALFPNDTESMLSETAPRPTGASEFSFRLPPGSDSFSFKLPAQAPSAAADAGGDDYSAPEALSDTEREQFAASTFSPGRIPTRPPPRALCF